MKKTVVSTLFIFVLLMALFTVFTLSVMNKDNIDNSTLNVFTKDTVRAVQTDEMRAVWVPYFSIAMDKGKNSKADFEQKFDKIIKTSAEKGLNTLIVQVRPFCDALYKSSYFPTSHILGIKQGDKIDYDPLEYMVKACHDADMKIHAWVNPLRVSTQDTPDTLSADNPAEKWKDSDYVLEWEGSKYLNPAYSEVRKLIIDGVCEIVENYEVDGIQFDDYFYPTTESDFDKTAYEKYTSSVEESGVPLTLNKWRTSNINMLVSGIYSAVHSIRDDIVFGISPQGNITNNESLCADIQSWCSVEGYVDYICPQIYFSLEHSLLPFEETAKEWRKLVTNNNVRLYLGLALYKAGSDDDDGTWEKSNDIISQQIGISRNLQSDGFMLYSYEFLDCKQTQKEVDAVEAMLINN